MRYALPFVVLLASPASADPVRLEVRPGATLGFQQTDRSAWVFGPSLEIGTWRHLSLHGDAQLELGDIDDPFGDSNIRGGTGPHVNHVMFGPVWRPPRYAAHQLAVGAELGILVMHSQFAVNHFTRRPAAGVFVQAGRTLGPVSLALQLRIDVSTTVDMGGPGGDDVTTTSGRFNVLFEVPLHL